jgi:hypothetical protein
MANLKRKVTALFLALMILAASIAVTGCKKQEAPTKTPAPSKQKLPDME